ncbi:DUF3099 domain-containing protein [Microbacterium ulmi]|uniref:DUF3099 domain-containing protein n=1 Tax=Microbacterium ulmi TaxID=179095 RepID=A0A7Y2LXY0_9MICO|nr:hypothetical protein [Microbacterium ulmi]NNH02865.1 DUF3099 domain-containing protein [Microbacterium ulmi]
MKSSTGPQSATSLPRAPRDDAGSRVFRYFVMMMIRVVCFVLMVLITPYGWHTVLLGIGAIFLPYVAVVIANVAQEDHRAERESPEKALPATPAPLEEPPAVRVIRIEESKAPTPPPDAGP